MLAAARHSRGDSDAKGGRLPDRGQPMAVLRKAAVLAMIPVMFRLRYVVVLSLLAIGPCPEFRYGSTESFVQMVDRMAANASAERAVRDGCAPAALSRSALATTATRRCWSTGTLFAARLTVLPVSLGMHQYVGSPSGKGSGAGAAAAQQPSYQCSCTKRFGSLFRLSQHQSRSGCIGTRAAVQKRKSCAAVEERAAKRRAREAAGEVASFDVRRIEQETLLSNAELHYEHHVQTATIQRAKEGSSRVSTLQSKAIKRALKGKLQPGVSLDGVIDDIMDASSRYSSLRHEAAGVEELIKEFRVTPIRRSLRPASQDEAELFMYDIPIEQSIEREMQLNPEFAQYVRDWGTPPASASGTYRSIKDGTASRGHPFLGDQSYQGPTRLAFSYYYDDVEVVNPIGVARTKHKVALHYAQLLNPPPSLSSQLDVIFLVGVVLHTTQDAVGVSTVVQGPKGEPEHGSSFGASMRRFHRPGGIRLRHPETGLTPYRGWLIVVAADALAAADMIGTFKSFGPNVKSICWQCDAPGGAGNKCVCDFLSTNPRFKLRTRDAYIDQRLRSEQLPIHKERAPRGTQRQQTQGEYMKSIGVRTFQHAFTRIPHYRAIETPKDLMHVELEGNLKVHLHGFLHQAVKKHGWFTRQQLNMRIRKFRFPSDRPPEIPATNLKGVKGKLPSPKGSITMTSGQMLQFVINSLEIFRPLLSAAARASAEYQAWVAHLTYFRLLLQRQFTDASITQLAEAIKVAQSKFLDITAYAKLWKPKNHFAQHFPTDIRHFGPPRFYWCMRFEAKNQEHKRAAKMGTFRVGNVPRTISRFWAIRSHLRLLRKSESASEPPQPGSRFFTHPAVEKGAWILIQRDGCEDAIAYVAGKQRVSEDGSEQLEVLPFGTSALLQQGPDGPFATVAALDVELESELVPMDADGIVIVPLQLHVHGGEVRFVEQP